MKLLNVVLVSLICHGSFAQDVDAFDFIPDATFDEIGDRLTCIEAEIPLNYNEKVKSFIDYFTIRDRGYSREILSNSGLYFPMFEAYLEKYELPKSLKYLAVVESGLRVKAVSHASAVGLWQFMSATGKAYGLENDWYIDDRMDPEKATEAACKHLKDLYRIFDDWELAIAAYNCGSGNVRKAIRRSGYKTKFWEIYPYLPRETRSYLPQFVAIAYTFNYAREHNLQYTETFPIHAVDTILISQYFHLETFAQELNVCLDDLLKLNPSIKRGALPEGTKNYALRIPATFKDSIVVNRVGLYDRAGSVGREELDYIARNEPGSTYGRQRAIHKVRSGDVLGIIANKYHVRIADIRSWNNINGNMIRIGQSLKIWVLPDYTSATKDLYVSARTTSNPLNDGQSSYRVQNGDSLWSIANAHAGLTIDELKKLNQLKSNTIKPGQELIISTR